MRNSYVLEHCIDVPCKLGENALWDHRQHCFWWTDILTHKLYRWWFKEDKLETFNLDESLCSFGLTKDPDLLICAFASGFALFSPTKNNRLWSLPVIECGENVRMNDGRVDPAGRFWSGSMDQELNGAERRGKLYRLDSPSRYTKILSNIHISNGLSWSKNGKSMYFTDSSTEEIKHYDFDLTSGTPSNPKRFALTNKNIHPDGCCVDTQGGVWSAHWSGSEVTRYMPNGETDVVLPVPARQPTSVCFGGNEMQHLFITSASDGLLKDARNPTQDGQVFIYRTPIVGSPQALYKPDINQQ